MARRTYTKETGHSPVLRLPFTRWIVRDADGRKLGTINAVQGGFDVYSGHYDRNDDLEACAAGAFRQTYRAAQAWFQGSN